MVLFNDIREYVDAGWCIIPMRAAKKPAVRWTRYQTKRPSNSTLRNWFDGQHVYDAAVLFGAVSGWLCSRDFDDMDEYNRWANKFSDLAALLPMVATPRPGRHVHFLGDPTAIAKLRDRLGAPQAHGAIAVAGGELRCGHGCYSMIPPSLHPSGRRYEWLRHWHAHVPILDPVEAGFFEMPHQRRSLHRGHRVHRRYCGLEGALEYDLETAIAVSLPTQAGRTHVHHLLYARYLKGMSEFRDLGPKSPELEEAYRKWYERGQRFIKIKSFRHSFAEFQSTWMATKFAMDTEPIRQILNAATQDEPPICAAPYAAAGELGMVELIKLCRALQREAGKHKAFYLASRPIAPAFGVSHQCIRNWLNALADDKILRLVKKGLFGVHKASLWRYLGD